ncbi:MAG TPA: hypothetical protein VJ440_02965, partial [Candidatus Brocadiaceae bacterium]|nr:hypothetical protein [Candidatus Brocadiaceae bacterium]
MKSREIPFRSYQSIPDTLIGTVQRHGDRAFSRIRVDEKIVSYTHGETLTNVQKIAWYLKKNGFS